MIDGVICVYKEKGWTSGDAVFKLKGVLHQKRVGHGGTLDPDAEGVLPVCVGKATRLFDYITVCPKTYIARVKFGEVTDTQDASGKVISKAEPCFTQAELDEALTHFTGETEQIPPMYSALHINGKRLYDLARKGETVELEPRKIKIYGIERISEYENGECDLRVCCGKGTYIRTLCHDLGQRLGCGAYMKTLLRTASAGLKIENAVTISSIEEMVKNGDFSFITPMDEAVSFLPKTVFSPEAFKKLSNGNPLDETLCISGNENSGLVRIYCNDVFFGIGERENGQYRLKCMLAEVK